MDKVERSDGKKSEGNTAATILKYLCGVLFIMIGSMVLYHLVMNHVFGYSSEDYSARGAFGDQFNTLGVVFSGAAFFLLVISTMFQSRDLKAQTEALKLQQVVLQQLIKEFSEQKEEVARSAEAQEIANRLVAIGIEQEWLKQTVAVALAEAELATDPVTKMNAIDSANNSVEKLKRLARDTCRAISEGQFGAVADDD